MYSILVWLLSFCVGWWSSNYNVRSVIMRSQFQFLVMLSVAQKVYGF